MALAIYTWCGGNGGQEIPDVNVAPAFDKFSSSYTAFFLFVILVIICSKKDLAIFMRIGSFGVVFVVLLIVFIMAMGFIALGDTHFVVGTTPESNATDWSEDTRTIVLFNKDFALLMGIFGAGYFIHTCSLPIVRSAKNPEKVPRDVFLGYLAVFISYAVVGSLGYVGFLGTKFSWYFEAAAKPNPPAGTVPGQIDGNCLNMFKYDDVGAFILRFSVFMLLFSTYPLVNFFLKTIIKNIFFRENEISRVVDFILNVSLVFIPLLFALFYPNISMVLAYSGAVAGFLIIYVFPVLVYLKQYRTKIMHPMLAEALTTNDFDLKISDVASPKIAIRDDAVRRYTKNQKSSKLTKAEQEK